MENQGLIETLISHFHKFFAHKDFTDWVIGAIVTFTARLIISFILFKLMMILVNFISKKLVALESNQKFDKSFVRFLHSMLKFFSYGILIVIILRIFGVNSVSIAALSGGAGVGIGLAVKDILSNFAGGAILLIFKPFKVGDFVEIDNVSGEVNSISIFSTEMNSIDNKKIFIPNGSVVTNKIINYSSNKVRRVDITFGIGYEDDFRKAIFILEELAKSHEKILQNIEKSIRVSELGDSSVNILFRVWCRNSDYWAVYFDIMEQAKEAFDKAGISIPFPQMDIHLKKDSDEGNDGGNEEEKEEKVS